MNFNSPVSTSRENIQANDGCTQKEASSKFALLYSDEGVTIGKHIFLEKKQIPNIDSQIIFAMALHFYN